MIVIISGTNRPGSNTRKVTARVEASYKALGVKTQVLDLAEMPPEIFAPTSYAEKPASFKKFTDAKFVISNAIFRQMTGIFSTDLSPNDENITLAPSIEGPWGQFPWGSAAWGGDNVNPQNVRTQFPAEKAQGHWVNMRLTHAQALTAFSLLGVAVFYKEVSERML